MKHRGRPKGKGNKPKLQVVPRSKPDLPPADLSQCSLDYPDVELTPGDGPVLAMHGLPLALNIQYVPWLDTLSKDELHEALVEDDSPKALEFASRLSDPKLGNIPITALAGRSGISVRELIGIWRHHKQVAAIGIAIGGAPIVAEHTIIDAQSVVVCCPRCDGAGSVQVLRQLGQEWITCPTCSGNGTVRRAGDAKSREWVLRAAGIIKPDTSHAITINNSANSTTTSVLDELERYTTLDTIALPDDDA